MDGLPLHRNHCITQCHNHEKPNNIRRTFDNSITQLLICLPPNEICIRFLFYRNLTLWHQKFCNKEWGSSWSVYSLLWGILFSLLHNLTIYSFSYGEQLVIYNPPKTKYLKSLTWHTKMILHHMLQKKYPNLFISVRENVIRVKNITWICMLLQRSMTTPFKASPASLP